MNAIQDQAKFKARDYRRLDKYLRSEIEDVAGYLNPTDAMAIAALGKFQTANGIPGDMCELGVHHGRLFFILAHLRRDGEQALAVDLFEDGPGNDNDMHRGRNKYFFWHIDRMSVPEPAVITGNTLELSALHLFDRIGPARIISVDAGHLYDEVDNDLRLAANILHSHGVIIADDYFNIYWPDVTTATNDFLAENTELTPFLITEGKLYICRKADMELYQRFADAFVAQGSIKHRTVELNKSTITAARLSAKGAIRHRFRGFLPRA